jgi:hypothetical protein
MTLLSCSGALYYMYNEVAFLALCEVNIKYREPFLFALRNNSASQTRRKEEGSKDTNSFHFISNPRLFVCYLFIITLLHSQVAPVTHAVTNTVKRVVIILASILFFHTPVSALGMFGSAIAILGATGYSYAKGKYK